MTYTLWFQGQSAVSVQDTQYFAGPLSGDFVAHTHRLWADPAIKHIVDTPSPDYNIPDSAA